MRGTSDPYTYPGSEVLQNIPGIRDPERLAAFEANVTAARLVELDASPLNGNFDAAHLRAIHRHIFQDIYRWAGEYRTVNISKGGQFFGAAVFAGQALDAALQGLPGEGYLAGVDSRTFARRAALYMSEINAIHPFRDGNGRAQREFIRQLGLGAGFALDWGAVTAEEMMAASVESFTTGNSAALAGVIGRCLE